MFAHMSAIIGGKHMCSLWQYGEFHVQIYGERLSCIQAHMGG